MVEVVTLTGTLTHSGKYREAGVLDGDVSNQFHQRHGLAYAGAAEQADFAAFYDRHDQVDDLDTGFKDVVATRLVFV